MKENAISITNAIKCITCTILVSHEIIWHWKMEGWDACFDYKHYNAEIWIWQETLDC